MQAVCTSSSRSTLPATGKRSRSTTKSSLGSCRSPRSSTFRKSNSNSDQRSSPGRRRRHSCHKRRGSRQARSAATTLPPRPVAHQEGIRRSSGPRRSDDIEATEIHELYRQTRPEDELVCQFHALWDRTMTTITRRPTDRTRARDILKTYGSSRRRSCCRSSSKSCGSDFPKREIVRCNAPILVRRGSKQHSVNRRPPSDEGRSSSSKNWKRGKPDRTEARPRNAGRAEWDRLSAHEQEAIQEQVLASNSPSMRLEKFPATPPPVLPSRIGQTACDRR